MPLRREECRLADASFALVLWHTREEERCGFVRQKMRCLAFLGLKQVML